MHVLHTHWHFPTSLTDSAGLLVWAEDSQAKPPRRRKKKSARPNPHPFCATDEAVWQLLQENKLLLPSTEKMFHRLALWLPTGSVGPQPAPQLVHDWEQDDDPDDLTLHPWRVNGVWLSPLSAFWLLNNLPADGWSHLTPGGDVHFWQTAIGLVLEALARQKLLPLLALADAKKPEYHARWLPVLDGSRDAPRVAQLLKAMPPLCRAETQKPENAPAPRIVLDSFLNAVTDTLARHWGEPRSLSGGNHSPERAWLGGLFSSSPTVEAAPAQLKHLHQSHQLWLRNLHVAGDKTFRISFRLEAPTQQEEADANNWQLHYLLQARDDPSLLVPAQQVWQTRSNVLKALDRRFEQPQEKLLAGLGYAARLFPPLRDSLKTATPESTTLTTPQAFEFLREAAPLLESSGFGVLVPPWWNKPGARLGVRLKINSSQSADAVTSNGNLNFENLVRYKWELSIGDTTLSREEFDALVALKSPLVQIRGQWVRLDPEQIEAAINFWQKQDLEADADLYEALQMGLGATDEVDGLPLEGVETDGWFKEWLDKLTTNETLTELPPPDSLQTTLRPYQQYGYSWLAFFRQWGMGACLADDMGLGKTIQTLAMLLREKEAEGKLPGPVLLICPTSVVSNWDREVKKFAPALTAVQHHGPDRLRDEAFIEQSGQVDMILTSYALARRDADTLQQINWFAVILDEAQNIKNPRAKQTRAIRQMPANFRLALTGTPVENRLSELWSIMHFLNPGYLGSRASFREQFALPIERYSSEEATRRLRKLVSPFILRRVKTDPTVIQDLPDKQEMKVYCTLSEEQATLYESVVQDAMTDVAEADGMQRRGLVLGMLMKLKQICNHPAQFLHQVNQEGDSGSALEPSKETQRSGKLARLTEMLEETIAVGDRVLIFTQFSEMGELLRTYLQSRLDVQTQFLYGGTPAKKREAMVRRFQDDEHGPPIFILSLKAGGTGLNLTRANHVFHFDRWWNPAVEDQATDRAFRIGQKQNVQVHKFVCVGTLEEMIDDMIENKKALAESVVGGGENWLTELSTDELRTMVTLRREALS